MARTAPVTWLDRHPEADLAVFGVDLSPWAAPRPFEGIKAEPSMGEDFYSYGFPRDSIVDEPTRATGRLFKGHIQRFFYYERDESPCEYRAVELNIMCPKGLSGGPVFTTSSGSN